VSATMAVLMTMVPALVLASALRSLPGLLAELRVTNRFDVTEYPELGHLEAESARVSLEFAARPLLMRDLLLDCSERVIDSGRRAVAAVRYFHEEAEKARRQTELAEMMNRVREEQELRHIRDELKKSRRRKYVAPVAPAIF